MDTAVLVILVVLAILVVWNLVTFMMYGADKKKAERGAMRTSEKTLITIAFLMGGVGAFMGMRFFRHKTDKPKFKLVPVAMVLNIIIVAAFAFLVISAF